MKADAKLILQKIIQLFGRDICYQADKLKSVLRDYYVDKKEANLLIEITKTRYFGTFFDSITHDTESYERMMLMVSINEDYEFEESYSAWGVECWAYALMPRHKADIEYAHKEVVHKEAVVAPIADALTFEDVEVAEAIRTTLSLQNAIEEMESINMTITKARGGDPRARFRLGEMYEFGRGVNPSYREAIKWYKMSALQGNHEAMYRLGEIYEQGSMVPANYEEALRWYRAAKEKGNTDAVKKIRHVKRLKRI